LKKGARKTKNENREREWGTTQGNFKVGNTQKQRVDTKSETTGVEVEGVTKKKRARGFGPFSG